MEMRDFYRWVELVSDQELQRKLVVIEKDYLPVVDREEKKILERMARAIQQELSDRQEAAR